MHEAARPPQNTYPQLYPNNHLRRGLTKANFDWNQLSGVSIGFSPLYPCHTTQQTRDCFGPPRHLTVASACTGIDQHLSGYIPMTQAQLTPSPSKLAVICFRFDFRLAIKINSLARYSERTMQQLIAASPYLYYVSDLFTFLLRILFNVPSRYQYTIGLELYLGLEVSGPHIHAQFPINATLEFQKSQEINNYGTITL